VPTTPEATLDIRVIYGGEHGTIELTGELDAGSAPRLSEVLNHLRDAGHNEVHVNLRNVSFLDSSGLGAFVLGNRMLAEAGGQLVLIRPSKTVRHLLDVTGLAAEFMIR
jgi:anti-sigma B factor antagonist